MRRRLGLTLLAGGCLALVVAWAASPTGVALWAGATAWTLALLLGVRLVYGEH